MSNNQERDGPANREPRKGAWSAEIERAGSVKLTAWQRRTLRREIKRYVESYRRWKDAHSKAPERLDVAKLLRHVY